MVVVSDRLFPHARLSRERFETHRFRKSVSANEVSVTQFSRVVSASFSTDFPPPFVVPLHSRFPIVPRTRDRSGPAVVSWELSFGFRKSGPRSDVIPGEMLPRKQAGTRVQLARNCRRATAYLNVQCDRAAIVNYRFS